MDDNAVPEAPELPDRLVDWVRERQASLASTPEPTPDLEAMQRRMEELVSADTTAGSWRVALDCHRFDSRVQQGGSDQLSLRALASHAGLRRRLDDLAGRIVDDLRLSALALTGLAMTLAVVGSVALLRGHRLIAAELLTAAGFFEFIDAVAAKRSRQSLRAVYLDYLSDRISDVAIIGAISLSVRQDAWPTAWVGLALLLAALTSSYARAQAVALRFPTSSRIGRAERFLALLGGVWISVLAPVNGIRCGVGLAAAVTMWGLIERVVSACTSESLIELQGRANWDPGDFLPRLLEDLVHREGQPVVLVESDGKALGSLYGKAVAFIEPGDVDGTTRVRILREPVRFPMVGDRRSARRRRHLGPAPEPVPSTSRLTARGRQLRRRG